eukprot:CAMPEP_0183340838 /NCGR_PEP_ID=MMETSP0164_2-20130417/7257_1 /TAXON_ID=221442 /ORGANISM="Coccolithus pelagicus ssp braarudi, Strain PLY182g" /LENGTH=255 /DNA_ID=CAMNT_0025511039 /DNA_START=6 /DNA_END=773 /DNA_ORIENTATION=-
MTVLARRVVASALTVVACKQLVLPASSSNGMEEIRKVASVLPGYGPPDLLFPPCFCGRWRVSRSVTAVATPLGESAAPADLLRTALAQQQSSTPAIYEARFLQLADSERGIADRAFNAEQKQAALSGIPLGRLSARWEPSNPNVLTLSDGSGAVVETKVTKRSFEAPRDDAFGTSEYARIADAGSSGALGAVPLIRASREQVRYRWEPVEAPNLVKLIEAIELEQVFDPTATGFADLVGATPVLTAKARLTFQRI